MTAATRNRRNAALEAHMVRRLLAIHGETTASDLAAGQRWYGRAQDAAAAMAVDGNTAAAAAVIAHLSPREQWATNVANAARVLEAVANGETACPAVHTHAQRDKAWRAANGETAPDVDHGPKTGAFFANIMGDSQRVCVDSWAARAATGDPTYGSPSRTQYPIFERAYQRAAAIVGMTPRDFQAAVWTHVRGAAD